MSRGFGFDARGLGDPGIGVSDRGAASTNPRDERLVRRARWQNVEVIGGRPIRQEPDDRGEKAPIASAKQSKGGSFSWRHGTGLFRRP